MLLMASAELLIILALLTISRETRGKHWCKTDGVGRMRQMIGPPVSEPEGVTDSRVVEYAREQRSAAAALAKHCRECGKCRLAREPIIGASLRLATSQAEAETV